jgi:uncharacterized membrane protein YdjX (TVP38/TMEM64 family)
MKPSPRAIRLISLLLLICAIAVGIGLLFFHPIGQELIHHPRGVGRKIHAWMHIHWVLAPLALIGLYILLTLAALPVWWLQVVAGYVFGIIVGIVCCQIAATIGAVLTSQFAHWLAADWFQKKIESKMKALATLDEKMGHNGFLVVMAARLSHVLPFALSNYAFGISRISVRDVAIGTALGGIPAVAISVMLGADVHPLRDWRVMCIIAAVNVILIVPVAVRYLKPEWFERMGVE